MSEPGHDLRRAAAEVGAQQSLRPLRAFGVSDQHPPQRYRRAAGTVPDGRVRDDFPRLHAAIRAREATGRQDRAGVNAVLGQWRQAGAHPPDKGTEEHMGWGGKVAAHLARAHCECQHKLILFALGRHCDMISRALSGSEEDLLRHASLGIPLGRRCTRLRDSS